MQNLCGCVSSVGGFYLSWYSPYNSEGDGAKSGKGGAGGNLINRCMSEGTMAWVSMRSSCSFNSAGLY